MISAAALALSLAVSLPAAGDRIRLAEIERIGPLEGARAFTAAGALLLTESLVAGERRVELVPVPMPSEGAARELAPEFELRGANGSVRFLRWADEEREARWSEVEPSLTRRGRPPTPLAGAAIVLPGLALAAAALVAGLALRRRAWPMLIAGTLAAAPIALWPPVYGLEAGTLVMECLGTEGAVATVRVSRGEIALNPKDLEDLLWVDVRPHSAPLVARNDPGVKGMRWWWLRAGGAEFVMWKRWEHSGVLSASENTIGTLERAWIRDGDAWLDLGPWPQGSPMPSIHHRREFTAAGSDSSQQPPAWLAAGLPRGERVLLARSEFGSWLRWVGFPLDG